MTTFNEPESKAWGLATLFALLFGFSTYFLTAAGAGFGLLAFGTAFIVFSTVLLIVYGICKAAE